MSPVSSASYPSAAGSKRDPLMSSLAPTSLNESPTRLFPHVAYRSLDITIALIALVVCLPLLAAACLAIRLDSPGFPIFTQWRVGREERRFRVHKLRTMRADADGEIHRRYIERLVAGVGEAHSTDGQSLYKLAADHRVTRVGRFLRKTSLDEIPQLFDVLLGHMSIVGPRPVIPYEVDLYPPDYLRRFAVKPGLTGLWQVSGRNERTYQEMVELDLDWVERRSIALYLSIVARTPLVLVQRRGVA